MKQELSGLLLLSLAGAQAVGAGVLIHLEDLNLGQLTGQGEWVNSLSGLASRHFRFSGLRDHGDDSESMGCRVNLPTSARIG